MSKKVIITLHATVQDNFYLPAFTGVVEGSTNIKVPRAGLKADPAPQAQIKTARVRRRDE